MDAEELKQRKLKTTEMYRQAGADLVIDSIWDLLPAIEELNHRMKRMKEA